MFSLRLSFFYSLPPPPPPPPPPPHTHINAQQDISCDNNIIYRHINKKPMKIKKNEAGL